PTNHLDIRSKDVLKEAIKDFEGTVIVVSHDRDFLDGLVSKIYEFGNEKVVEHLGGIYDFLQKKRIESLNELQREEKQKNKKNIEEESNTQVKLDYEEQKEQNRQLKRLEREVKTLEKEMDSLNGKLKTLEQQMVIPENASDASLFMKYEQLKKEYEKIESNWEIAFMELSEYNEI
ncbi:MAG: ABC transporter ATP-binding protein, partial [Bacteroidales bacterium]|nr:ABC transporter ATP-binding protein [Bacteroidales bacterium]